MAVTKTEFVVLRKAALDGPIVEFPAQSLICCLNHVYLIHRLQNLSSKRAKKTFKRRRKNS
jgi:hypothetical protein